MPIISAFLALKNSPKLLEYIGFGLIILTLVGYFLYSQYKINDLSSQLGSTTVAIHAQNDTINKLQNKLNIISDAQAEYNNKIVEFKKDSNLFKKYLSELNLKNIKDPSIASKTANDISTKLLNDIEKASE